MSHQARKLRTKDVASEHGVTVIEKGDNTPMGLVLVEGLNDLSVDQLLAKLEQAEQVESQGSLAKWRIWWAIRQKFPSDKLFGKYVAELRGNPTHAWCVGSQQDINRALNAGRFCERYNITDLNKVKLYQTSLYYLSQPQNEAIADKVYHSVRGRDVPAVEVEKLLAKAREESCITIEPIEAPKKEPEVSGGKYAVQVKDNVAQLPGQPSGEGVTYDVFTVTDDQIVAEVLRTIAKYGKSPIVTVRLLQKCIEVVTSNMYPQKGPRAI